MMIRGRTKSCFFLCEIDTNVRNREREKREKENMLITINKRKREWLIAKPI